MSSAKCQGQCPRPMPDAGTYGLSRLMETVRFRERRMVALVAPRREGGRAIGSPLLYVRVPTGPLSVADGFPGQICKATSKKAVKLRPVCCCSRLEAREASQDFIN